jgi:hypothetical protein
VAFGVSNDDDGLESGALTGAGLLLNGLDLSVERSYNQPTISFLLSFLSTNRSNGVGKSIQSPS